MSSYCQKLKEWAPTKTLTVFLISILLFFATIPKLPLSNEPLSSGKNTCFCRFFAETVIFCSHSVEATVVSVHTCPTLWGKRCYFETRLGISRVENTRSLSQDL